jgi:hypothetical protein
LLAHNHFEQQKIILEVVINKLGDPDYQVASRIIYLTKNFSKHIFLLQKLRFKNQL